jgi:hypothetical protein
MSMQIY